MATDNLQIFGTGYTNVAGIKATDSNGVIKTYIRPQGTRTITGNGTDIDVTEYATVDVNIGTTWELMTQGTFNITQDGDTGYIQTYLSPFEQIEQGEIWRITWNNTQYTCTAQELLSVGSEYGIGYGIGNAIGLGGTTGNNEPFFGGCFEGSVLLFLTHASSGTVNLIVEKQIPTGKLWQTVFSGKMHVNGEEDIDWYGVYNPWYEEISQNAVYKVTWDGVPYICTATYTDDWFDNYCLGNQSITVQDAGTGNNEPFMICRMWGNTLVTFTSTEQSVYLKIEKLIGLLAPKTITENGTYNATSEHLDGYSSVTVNVAGNTTYTTVFDEDMIMHDGSPGWAVFEYYLVPFTANQTYKVTFNGIEYICETQADIGEMNTYDGYFIGNASYAGGTNTGEPFLMSRDAFSDPDPNHVQLAFDSYATGTVHVKIELAQEGGSTLIPKTITANGEYDPADDNANGYSVVTVNVSGGQANLQAKTNVSPTTSSQTITPDSGYDGLSSVQINAMPSGSALGPSTISGTSATVSTGTNTLTLTKSVTVTPTVSAGYVSAGTGTNSTVTLTASVTTKAAATITPGTSNQTIASGTYLTGAQTIAGDADLVASNIISTANIFGVQGNVVIQHYYTGTGTPSNSTGANGDIYLKTS